ncbi:MAG: hypothetical protein MUO97_11370 [Dehalococcoidia bacterium]|nr:hypothetical protein [Dehalococcoidia bacterium]
MPRPLYIFKSVVEEDSSVTHKKIGNLLGEIVNVSDKAHKCLAQCIQLLTKKDRASTADIHRVDIHRVDIHRVDIHTVDLGVRVWNDLKVASELTRNGFYLQSMMLLRDAVETRAMAEYLHSLPNKAEAWWKAKEKQERLCFSMKTIKGNIEEGQKWYDIWDWLSSHIHPTSKATAVYATDKPYYGHYLFLGGFYDPGSVEFTYTLQLDLCIEFLGKMMNLYKNEPEFADKLSRDIDSLKSEYHIQASYLKERAESENKEVVDKVVSTRLSRDEIIQAFKLLDRLS